MMTMGEYFEHLAELGKVYGMGELLSLQDGKVLFQQIMDTIEQELRPGDDRLALTLIHLERELKRLQQLRNAES